MQRKHSQPYKTVNNYIILVRFVTLLLFMQNLHAAPLPELGSSHHAAFSEKTEANLGRAFLSALHEQYSINDDPETVTYIRSLGQQVAQHSQPARNFTFIVINNDSINAFAGPDGIIGIHTGLIQAAQSEDELASVIAHEIAHITQQHLMRNQTIHAKQGNLTQFATILAAILIGSQDSSAIMPTLMAGMGANIEQQLKHSRQHEHEADHIGIELLFNAGYDPSAMSRFFARLDKTQQYNVHQPPEILRTHPVTANRIAQADNRALAFQRRANNNVIVVPNRLSQIKERLQRQNDHPLETKQHVKGTYKQDSMQCYQHTLIPDAELKENNCLLGQLEKQLNNPFYFTLLLEKVTTSPNVPNKLIQQINQHGALLLALHPSHYALHHRMADFWYKQGLFHQATTLLIHFAQNSDYRYLPYLTLAQWYANDEQLAYAYLYQAKAELEIGNLNKTEHFLNLAKKYNISNNKDIKGQVESTSNISKNLLD